MKLNDLDISKLTPVLAIIVVVSVSPGTYGPIDTIVGALLISALLPPTKPHIDRWRRIFLMSGAMGLALLSAVGMFIAQDDGGEVTDSITLLIWGIATLVAGVGYWRYEISKETRS